MDIRTLDLNLLVALEALLAERNVTRAASRLNISQPALSARLARLRDFLGDQLLIPAQRGMIPTKRALELQEPLHRALDAVRSIVAEQSPFDPTTTDLTIVIAASDYVQYAILMPLSFILRNEAPNVRIAWRMIDGRTIGQQMEKGEADIGFITPETAPDNLRTRGLYREDYVLIARRSHPTVDRSINLETFASLDHLIVSPRGGSFEGATDIALRSRGFKRRVVLSVGSFLVAPEVVARSDLVALVPERLVRDRGDRLQTFSPPLPIDGFSINMIWHDRTMDHPAYRWLRERIVTFIENGAMR